MGEKKIKVEKKRVMRKEDIIKNGIREVGN